MVSFLNTLPLIDGLESLNELAMVPSVPSCLINQLLTGESDIALCSSIDYQHTDQPLRIVRDAGILGCDGPTLTVRLYASQPIHTLKEIFCDTDSHTSIVLMQILMREMYEIDPTITAYDAREHVANNKPLEWPPAMLLIGDKVVTDSPPAVRYPHQLDLGSAWANHTGLPFVFAMWLACENANLEAVHYASMAIEHQRRYNSHRLESIASQHAPQRGWPLDLARTYLTSHLSFEWTEDRQAGLELYFDKAHQHGLIEEKRPLVFESPIAADPAATH